MRAVVFVALLVLAAYVADAQLNTCGWGGRGACVASCKAQNCATGSCSARGVCICSRCGTGAGWPNLPGKIPRPGTTINFCAILVVLS